MKGKGKDFEGEDDDYDLSIDMYTKKKPLPGQLNNCELCGKRFTVTTYSKTGPKGALLCVKCSNQQDTERRKDGKDSKKALGGEKRRQMQSNLLDGIVQIGSKSLQELCVKVQLINLVSSTFWLIRIIGGGRQYSRNRRIW